MEHMFKPKAHFLEVVVENLLFFVILAESGHDLHNRASAETILPQ